MTRIEDINKQKRMSKGGFKPTVSANNYMLKKKHKKWTPKQDDDWDKAHNVKEHSPEDNAVDKIHGIKDKRKRKMMSAKEAIRRRGFKKHKGYRKPKPTGRGIVKALGQKGTTGNFAKIEKSKGKGAAIAALQNKLAARRGQPIPFHRKGKK